MDDVTVVRGEPVLSGGRGQDSWQEQIRQQVRGPLAHPALTFVVSGLRRRGHPFDLDNLVHPVLMEFDEPLDSVSARLYVGAPSGLLIGSGPPHAPAGEPLRSLHVPAHSTGSMRDRPGIPEIADDPVFDAHEGVGVSLAFDRADIPIRKGWFGPTEAVIDDLAPWLGRYTVRGLVADHRIRDLRISRGKDPTNDGVSISIWYVDDAAVRVPSHVQELLQADDGSP